MNFASARDQYRHERSEAIYMQLYPTHVPDEYSRFEGCLCSHCNRNAHERLVPHGPAKWQRMADGTYEACGDAPFEETFIATMDAVEVRVIGLTNTFMRPMVPGVIDSIEFSFTGLT